jgi:TatD DNase family protein
MIDTHAHLFLDEFDADREAVLTRAFAAGVTDIYMPNIDVSSLERLLACTSDNPSGKWSAATRHAIGLHPTSVDADYQSQLSTLKKAVETHQPAAIGEIGLDFYWDTTFAAEQLDAFEQQIQWAAETRLPILIHSRSSKDDPTRAHREICRILNKYPDMRGIFHCFGGSKEEAEQLLHFPNFYLGIGGSVTYKNSPLPQVLREAAPLERIVLETDAPYLSPVPHRGQRNEPSYLTFVCQTLAELYSLSPAAIDKQTTNNCRKLF